MSESTMQLLWYLVVGVAMIAYTVLDGFDLGVGMLHLFTKTDDERRILLNAIGPVWDGNEVWLVVIGGALFAGFPSVYAFLFSGFYNLCMLLVAGLIFRAVAIEFRSQRTSRLWRMLWDTVFALASFVIAFGIGIALGNLIHGVPINTTGDLIKEHFHPLNAYTILVGLTTVALFMMHGAIFLVMKTEGALEKKLDLWSMRCILFFIFLFALTSWATLVYMPHMVQRMRNMPLLFGIGVLAFLAIANVPREMHKKRTGIAFTSSCIGIGLLVGLFGIGTFPYLVRSTVDTTTNSLTIYNTASSPLTLTVLLTIVAIGVPLVLAYGVYIYRTFRGKVKLGPTSY